jgi:excisionase family DNA binding protein
VTPKNKRCASVSSESARTLPGDVPQCWRARSEVAPNIRAISIRQAATAIGISRSKIYEEIAAERLRAIKVDTRTLIRVSDLDEYVATRPALNSASKHVANVASRQGPSRPAAGGDFHAASDTARARDGGRDLVVDIPRVLAALRGEEEWRRLVAGDRDRLLAVIDILRRLLERGNV